MTKSRADNVRAGAGTISMAMSSTGGAKTNDMKSMEGGAAASRMRQNSVIMNVNKVKQQIMQEVSQSISGQGKVQILDDLGNDVTPISLVPTNRKKVAGPGGVSGEGGAAGKGGGMAGAGSKSTVASSFSATELISNFEHINLAPNNKTRGESMIKSFSENANNVSASSKGDFGESFDDFQEARNTILTETDNKKDESAGAGAPKILTEKELSKQVKIILQETEDVWLLDIAGSYVPNDSLEEPLVKASNARYQAILDARSRAENLVHRAMQTLTDMQKNKDTQASGRKRVSSETQCNDWQIYDETVAKAANDANKNQAQAANNAANGSGNDVETSTSMDAFSSMDPSQSLFSVGSTVVGSRRRMAAAQREEEDMREIYANIDDPVNQGGGMGNPSKMVSNSDSNNSGATSAVDSFFQTENSNMNSSILAQNRQLASAGIMTAAGVKETPKLSSLDVENLMESVRMMENVMVENTYTKNQFSYRGIDKTDDDQFIIPDEKSTSHEEKTGGENAEEINDMDHLASQMPSLNVLYNLRAELTRSRTITCIAYNHRDPNILAISYSQGPGSSTSNINGGANANNVASGAAHNKLRGLILCWSLKNVEHPERIFKTDSEANCLDFASSNPYLLAVGMNDGRIAVYDVRSREDECIVDNSETGGKHKDSVWDIRWIERERMGGSEESSKRESLISISLDSRVCQWVLRKGLEYNVTKSSQQNNSSSSNSSSSFLSRQTGGLCFDFNPTDKSIYLAGTEDGAIHRCSCSYNEQYLDSYFGHTGSVLKVKWSPFLEGVFLSCSADWTIRLWKAEQENYIFKFQSGHDIITDIAWSPLSSTIFAAVTKDGRIEIWDLMISTLDPIINHSILDRKLTSVSFAPNAPVLLTGDDYGNVTVYRLQRVYAASVKAYDISKMSVQEEREWRLQESRHLQYVIEHKNNSISGQAVSEEKVSDQQQQ